MKELEGVKAIIFDLGGVILNIDYHLTVKEFEKLGIENFDQIFSQFTQSTLSDDFETGKISERQFYEGIMSLTGKDFSFVSYQKAWNALLLDLPQERIALLKKLSQSYPLYLYSNTNETHYNQFITVAKEGFDSVFQKTYYSHILGERKPNKKGFLKILAENKLSPSETLFVDDSVQHIQTAKSLGMRTIHITNLSIMELF